MGSAGRGGRGHRHRRRRRGGRRPSSIGDVVIYHHLDIRSEDDWRATLAATLAAFRPGHRLLVNNAGIARRRVPSSRRPSTTTGGSSRSTRSGCTPGSMTSTGHRTRVAAASSSCRRSTGSWVPAGSRGTCGKFAVRGLTGAAPIELGRQGGPGELDPPRPDRHDMMRTGPWGVDVARRWRAKSRSAGWGRPRRSPSWSLPGVRRGAYCTAPSSSSRRLPRRTRRVPGPVKCSRSPFLPFPTPGGDECPLSPPAPVDGVLRPRVRRGARRVRAELRRRPRARRVARRSASTGATSSTSGAGHLDAARTRPWERDTLVCVFSCTKGVVAIATMWAVAPRSRRPRRAGRRVLARVRGRGQGRPPRALAAHPRGRPARDRRRACRYGSLSDWDAMTTALAAQAPWWEPGTAHGYHGVTFGHLIGEVLRRATGRTCGEIIRDELAAPARRRPVHAAARRARRAHRRPRRRPVARRHVLRPLEPEDVARARRRSATRPTATIPRTA